MLLPSSWPRRALCATTPKAAQKERHGRGLRGAAEEDGRNCLLKLAPIRRGHLVALLGHLRDGGLLQAHAACQGLGAAVDLARKVIARHPPPLHVLWNEPLRNVNDGLTLRDSARDS